MDEAPSPALLKEFKYVIRRAMLDGDYDRAEAARETALDRHGIDLVDYMKHPAFGDAVA
jgi:hypothetical protein